MAHLPVQNPQGLTTRQQIAQIHCSIQQELDRMGDLLDALDQEYEEYQAAIPSSARTLAASACSAGNPPTAEDVVIQYQQLENDALDEMRNNRNQNEVLQQSMAAMQKIPETKTNQGNPPS
ncbi:uncharacterized protein LOC124363879 [Homalodisca vitripennis]|uniref:uncharacterized protein LOC124363879 n=1 Tax=Homalodisca vitripennis TaxID=197043 RepID=UPI001EECE5F1|nr:uncharacterized protein LOC124363879 [Homalodisca vitripennis]XP_046675108.1 uncharacterized protein LOC124363879 [Homalodisca vitripennis]KAG8287613.1 hypothetical protein J6590_033184 [Homalodisca vitripennis]